MVRLREDMFTMYKNITVTVVYFLMDMNRLLQCEDDPRCEDRGTTCSFVMLSLVVIPFFQLQAMGKTPYLTSFVPAILMSTWTSSLATKDAVIRSGTAIYKYTYNAL